MRAVNDSPSTSGAGGVSRDRVVLWCLAGFSAACAVIHFAVARPHFEEYWVFGVLMLIAASLQLLWALWAVLRPSSPPPLIAGILLNGGIVCVYLITRTVGDVIGPTPHAVEPVGFIDAYCTLLEVLLVLGCGWLWLAPSRALVPLSGRLVSLSVIAGVCALFLSLALVVGGSGMPMSS